MRLFVAAELPAAVGDALAERAAAIASAGAQWRAVPRDSLHVTLAFLGEQPEDRVPELIGALPELAGTAAALAERRFSRVWALELDSPDLVAAHAALRAAGVGEDEGRRFRPHVTLARPRVRCASEPVAPDALPEPFPVGPVTLFRSRLHPRGARYERLGSAR